MQQILILRSKQKTSPNKLMMGFSANTLMLRMILFLRRHK